MTSLNVVNNTDLDRSILLELLNKHYFAEISGIGESALADIIDDFLVSEVSAVDIQQGTGHNYNVVDSAVLIVNVLTFIATVWGIKRSGESVSVIDRQKELLHMEKTKIPIEIDRFEELVRKEQFVEDIIRASNERKKKKKKKKKK